MAKPTGPLLSVSARGTVGKVLTFGSRLGVNTVRMWVIPKNLKSNDQAEVRTKLAIPGKIAKACERAGEGAFTVDSTYVAQMKAAVSAGQTWNSQLAKEALGTNLGNYDSDAADYAGTEAGEKLLWIAGAVIAGIVDFEMNYGAFGPVTNGEILFHAAKVAYRSGLAIAATDPTDWIEATINTFAGKLVDAS